MGEGSCPRLLKLSPGPTVSPGQGRAHFGSVGGVGEVFCWRTGRAAEVVGCGMHEFWLGPVSLIHKVYYMLGV